MMKFKFDELPPAKPKKAKVKKAKAKAESRSKVKVVAEVPIENSLFRTAVLFRPEGNKVGFQLTEVLEDGMKKKALFMFDLDADIDLKLQILENEIRRLRKHVAGLDL